MEVVEVPQRRDSAVARRLAKPLSECFHSELEAERVWREQDAEALLDSGFIKAEPVRPSSKVMAEFMVHVHRVRRAQHRGDHQKAIRLTARALRAIRAQPRYRRSALNRQTQELLNLRSISLIAVGECGEAWRCISLMAKLW